MRRPEGGPQGGDRAGGPVGATTAGPGALLAACALHLGFQAVVTRVVYPALAEVPADRFAAAHAAHSRRIAVVVAPVYGVLAAACLRALPAVARQPLLLVPLTASAAAAATTAAVAAPTHRRLGREGPAPTLLRRLRRADRVRLVCALVAACGATAAAVSAPARARA
ncbi:hypothetical protein [Cellulomonas marina]|uniref:DUF1772 domain-containing protein n=1 Tax=Cellulomonas marina TaxID=988821 RepID=A0A1I1AGH8_9CELL|nr:hypothetical protein [Cellulomonas marina]GIG29747.1 hypothetical protein Cma02nite_23470 [Cellulomonas marina]SFB35608.1 hypothetical protein SAMN05421867_1177 [Cellulomonas marina]